jgi:hypothetical protein
LLAALEILQKRLKLCQLLQATPFTTSNSSQLMKPPFSLWKLVISKTARNVQRAGLPLMLAVGGNHLLCTLLGKMLTVGQR